MQQLISRTEYCAASAGLSRQSSVEQTAFGG